MDGRDHVREIEREKGQPADRQQPQHGKTRRLAGVVAGVVMAVLAVGAPAHAATIAVPHQPTGLPSGIEALSPYIPQTSCDPVAKPGVIAFQNLILQTYPNTGSSGIVSTCAAEGMVSEHSEGRAFDWTSSVNNPTQKAQVDTLLNWLLATDNHGNQAANARRLGVMYIIWNHRIWGSYAANSGWRAYNGSDPHTGHVHFSFTWAGAEKRTSWWTKSVAAVDYGPCVPRGLVYAHPYSGFNGSPCPSQPSLPGGSTLLQAISFFAGTTLIQGDVGPAVAAAQQALQIGSDGDFGPQTRAAVAAFQQSHGGAPSGIVGQATWQLLAAAVTERQDPPHTRMQHQVGGWGQVTARRATPFRPVVTPGNGRSWTQKSGRRGALND
jgi:hypothetical protein